jgi:site-specific DNA-adenine methylase
MNTATPSKFRFAPFPYFGGKRNIAKAVWERLGNPTQYIEPFCGSAAVLLAAPKPASLEVIGDSNLYIANFWRCIRFQPEQVYVWQDYPVSHIDLDARHRWLTDPKRTAELQAALSDADWPGDAKVAGWWVWGQCCWIGSGWCDSQIPHASDAGRGVQSKIPHASDAGRGVQSKIPHASDAGRGVLDWLRVLSCRLERVRVNHGDWRRMLNHHYGGNNTAVFFDPPYKSFESLYHKGTKSLIADEVADWCSENEHLKIALCGLSGDYNLTGWTEYKWSRGSHTYGGAKTTSKECIWFSPACESNDLF